jgi:hypothetical protein
MMNMLPWIRRGLTRNEEIAEGAGGQPETEKTKAAGLLPRPSMDLELTWQGDDGEQDKNP